MASVFWKSGRWYQRYKSWGKWRKKASPRGWTKAKSLAATWGRERAAANGEAPAADAGSMLLRELCEWWLSNWCKAPSLARERSRLEANVTRQPLGSLPLEKLTAEAVEARLREMEGEGAAPASVEHVRRTLRTVFNRARKSKLWMNNPAAEAHPRSMEPLRVQETLAEEEVAVVLAHVEEPWKRDFVAAAIYTGMRKGELLGLERAAVDLEGGTINVARSHARQTTKGGHRDTIPIARPLRPFLEHALDASPESELVFPGPDGGRRREDLDAVAIVRTALKRAGLVEAYEHVCRRCKGRGLKDHTTRATDGEQRRCARCGMRLWPRAIPRHVTFHGLRHTTATLLLRAGVDPHRVQRILRHRDVQTTTKTYAHLLTEDLRGAVNLLPAAAPPEAGAVASGAAGGARRVPLCPSAHGW